jgi:methionine-rich copper-binding protein CopC
VTLRPSRRSAETIGARIVAIAAVALALGLPLGPVVAANASTTASTQSGVSLRGNSQGDGFAAQAILHNQLISTDPPYGAARNAGPVRVTLIFDLPAQRGFSTVIVTGPDDNQWQAGPAIENGTTVSAPVRPLGPAGEYTVSWRIVSADGHPVHGTYPLTLTTPGPGTAAASPPKTDRSGSAAPATDTGSASWLWLAGAGAGTVISTV